MEGGSHLADTQLLGRKTKVLKSVSRDFWDDVVKSSQYATFFHTYEWAKIMSETFPEYSISTRGFIMEDGTRVILPLISISAKVFKRYISMEPGVYGGPVTDGRLLEQEEIDAIFQSIISPRVAQISITGNPLEAYELPDQFQVIGDFTQVLDLRQTFDAIYRNWSKGHKRGLRRAQKAGVSVRPASSEEEIAQYFRCYQDSLRRWGASARSFYPIELFFNIFRYSKDSGRIWLAFFDGVVISGAVVFYHNRHAVYWHGASLEQFFDKYPNILLHYVIIKDACAKGFQFYDFNPSGRAGSLEGVVVFKQRFGTEKYPLNRWQWDSPIWKALKEIRRRLGVHDGE